MNRRFIRQADSAALARQVSERQVREYAERRAAVQAGSAEERRALVTKNHAGVGHVRWSPDRTRRA